MGRFTTTIALLIMLTASAGAQNHDNTYWKATLGDNTLLLLKLHQKGNKFSLTSRKGSSHAILGKRYLLARILGKVRPYSIEITGSCQIGNDTLYLKGQYSSLTSQQQFKGYLHNGQIKATLTNNVLEAILVTNGAPLKDYHAIAQAAVDTAEMYLYNPTLLKDSRWVSFKKKLLAATKHTADSYEFEKQFNFNVQNLPFSHFGIKANALQQQPTGGKAASDIATKAAKKKFALHRLSETTVQLVVSTFTASAEEITPYIDTLKTLNPKNLIVDLRNNPGGTIASALPLARYLVNDTLMGGVFLTQKYFLKHQSAPQPTDYQKFPLFSEASFPLIISGIHRHEGLCLAVFPDKQTFKGNLYLLTNGATGSTCEPLVYGLKISGRATVVGERTYGGMLNGESFPIGKEYSLWLPTADYYAADGFKIDKNGVEPNLKVKSDEALSKTLEVVAKQNAL